MRHLPISLISMLSAAAAPLALYAGEPSDEKDLLRAPGSVTISEPGLDTPAEAKAKVEAEAKEAKVVYRQMRSAEYCEIMRVWSYEPALE